MSSAALEMAARAIPLVAMALASPQLAKRIDAEFAINFHFLYFL